MADGGRRNHRSHKPGTEQSWHCGWCTGCIRCGSGTATGRGGAGYSTSTPRRLPGSQASAAGAASFLVGTRAGQMLPAASLCLCRTPSFLEFHELLELLSATPHGVDAQNSPVKRLQKLTCQAPTEQMSRWR